MAEAAVLERRSRSRTGCCVDVRACLYALLRIEEDPEKIRSDREYVTEDQKRGYVRNFLLGLLDRRNKDSDSGNKSEIKSPKHRARRESDTEKHKDGLQSNTSNEEEPWLGEMCGLTRRNRKKDVDARQDDSSKVMEEQQSKAKLEDTESGTDMEDQQLEVKVEDTERGIKTEDQQSKANLEDTARGIKKRGQQSNAKLEDTERGTEKDDIVSLPHSPTTNHSQNGNAVRTRSGNDEIQDVGEIEVKDS